LIGRLLLGGRPADEPENAEKVYPWFLIPESDYRLGGPASGRLAYRAWPLIGKDSRHGEAFVDGGGDHELHASAVELRGHPHVGQAPMPLTLTLLLLLLLAIVFMFGFREAIRMARIAALPVATIFIILLLATSAISRYAPSTEMRISTTSFADQRSAELWNTIAGKKVNLIPDRTPTAD
jgi:hypothetical protein